jgi:hypothetical protein
MTSSDSICLLSQLFRKEFAATPWEVVEEVDVDPSIVDLALDIVIDVFDNLKTKSDIHDELLDALNAETDHKVFIYLLKLNCVNSLFLAADIQTSLVGN